MRNDIINMVNDIFDENVDLKIRNAYLEAKEKEREESVTCELSCEPQEKTKLDIKIIEYGKKALAKETLSTWGNEVSVYRDDDSKEIIITSFDKWLKERIIDSSIPNDLSRAELKELIYPYAVERYEKEKAESMKKFEEKELKESEEK